MPLGIRIILYLFYIFLIIKTFKKKYFNNGYAFNITLRGNIYFIKVNIYIYFPFRSTLVLLRY